MIPQGSWGLRKTNHMAITLGNDISKWQGQVNWDVLKNNTQFIILKVSEGNGYKDPNFSHYQSEARRVGLPLGYYHFARPDLKNTPEAEADWFLKTIGELREGELLFLDYEPAGQVQAWVEWCFKWLERVREKTGVRCPIYLNQSQVKKFDWSMVINGGYGLWIAAYTYDPRKNDFEKGQWSFAMMQQWSNSQQVPGIPAAADGNVFFGDLETLKKYGYHKPQPAPQPTPEPTPQPDPQPEYTSDLSAEVTGVTVNEKIGNVAIKLTGRFYKDKTEVSKKEIVVNGRFDVPVQPADPQIPACPEVITDLNQKVKLDGYEPMTLQQLQEEVKKQTDNALAFGNIVAKGQAIAAGKYWWWVRYSLWKTLFS